MYFLTTVVAGFAVATFVFNYSRFITWIFSKIEKENDYEDEICYSKHPMSDSEDEDEVEEEEEDEDEEELEDFMKDFYEETTFSQEWLNKTDQEKREILDRELDVYMNKVKKIREELDNIKC